MSLKMSTTSTTRTQVLSSSPPTSRMDWTAVGLDSLGPVMVLDPSSSAVSLEGTWDCSSTSAEDDLRALLGITTTTMNENVNSINAAAAAQNHPGYGTTTLDYVSYNINTPVMSEEEGEGEDSSASFAFSAKAIVDNNSSTTTEMFFDHHRQGDEDLVFELEVPVLSQDFNSQWDSQVVKKEEEEEQEEEKKISFFGTNPMACFNPLDVEGKEKNLFFESPVVVKKTKKILSKLIMPSMATTTVKQQVPSTLNTPLLQSVIRQQKEQSGFDLLEWVTNAELPVDDPEFLQMLEDVSPPQMTAASPEKMPELSTVDLADIMVTPPPAQALPSRKRKAAVAAKASVVLPSRSNNGSKRGRGRPSSTVTSSSLAAAAAAAAGTASTSTSDHSYMTNYDSSTSGFSADDVKDAQYRRMRDLNNLASKRCRQNRKNKFDTLLDEEGKLRKTNAELRRKCKHMEDLVKEMKRKFIEKVTNPEGGGMMPKAPMDLDGFFEKMRDDD